VLAIVVILEKDRYLRVRLVIEDVLRVDVTLGLIIEIEAHGPGKILRIAPFGGAGVDKDVWHPVDIDVLVDRGIGRRTQSARQKQHLFLFDQFAHLFHGAWRAITVIETDEINLAEIVGLGASDRAVGRGWAAIGISVANPYFAIACPRTIFLFGMT